jgi:hypothetical protein
MRTTRSRTPSESADAVGLIIALLVRFPHVATLVSHPNDGTVTISFVLARKLDKATQVAVRELLLEHVRSFTQLAGDPFETLEVDCEVDERMSFVRLTRDARSLSREELQLVTGLLAERFGDALLVSPSADDDGLEEDAVAQDELVDYALEALRDPSQRKSLVGFREEKRVFVYFVAARKKAKARARS